MKCVLKEDVLEVSGGGLDYVYSTLQFHFHWGSTSNDSEGSEHTVDSHRYPMEVVASTELLCCFNKGIVFQHILLLPVYNTCHCVFVQMHIVNKRKNLTLNEALQTPNGLAVLGFFIEVTLSALDHLSLVMSKF